MRAQERRLREEPTERLADVVERCGVHEGRPVLIEAARRLCELERRLIEKEHPMGVEANDIAYEQQSDGSWTATCTCHPGFTGNGTTQNRACRALTDAIEQARREATP